MLSDQEIDEEVDRVLECGDGDDLPMEEEPMFPSNSEDYITSEDIGEENINHR